MPIYEYQCDACHHTFDLLQKISDEPIKTCPACGMLRVKKLVSAAGFQLKGTGWYVTDFKDSGKKTAKKNEPKTESTQSQKEPAANHQPTKRVKSDTGSPD